MQTGMSTLPRGWSRRSQGAPEECHAAFLSLKQSVSLSRSELPWSDGIPLPAICPSRQSSRAAAVAKSPGFSCVTKCFEASSFFLFFFKRFFSQLHLLDCIWWSIRDLCYTAGYSLAENCRAPVREHTGCQLNFNSLLQDCMTVSMNERQFNIVYTVTR